MTDLSATSEPISVNAVERRLKVTVACLVGFSAVLLGIAQQNLLLPVGGVVAAAVAHYVTDIRGWFRFNRLVANLVALLAAVAVMTDFLFLSSNRDQLAAITNLLLCLQFVLLFQEKSPRTYGYIAILCLLQVVVSAALPVRVEFGIVLVPFMITAVLFLYNLYACSLVWPSRKTKPLSPEAWMSVLTTLTSMAAIFLYSDFGYLSRLIQIEILLDGWTKAGMLLVTAFGVFLMQFLRIQLMPPLRGRRRRLLAALCIVGALQVVFTIVIGSVFSIGVVLFAALPIGLLVLKHTQYFEPAPANDLLLDEPPDPEDPALGATNRSFASLLGTQPKTIVPGNAGRLARELGALRMGRSAAALSTATLVFAAVLFASVPRPRGAQPVSIEEQAVISAPEGRVTLNELGNLLHGNEVVMRVEFRDEKTGAPYEVFGDVYMRGTVLQLYRDDPESGEYSWSSLPDMRTSKLQPAPGNVEVVREKLLVQPLRVGRRSYGSTLYSVYPAFAPNIDGPRIEFTEGSKHIMMPPEPTGIPHPRRFELLTTGFYRGLQLSVYPHEYGLMTSSQGRSERVRTSRDAYSYIDKSRYPHITKLADDLVAELRSDTPDADRAQVCRVLMDHFLYSEQFVYTTDFSKVKRTPGMDPIEDFVANNHQGHCEYFASALALALRTQGIPSRLVIGYHGGTYNSLGNFYEFKQHHAHAWVEAFLEPGDITPSMLQPGQSARYGAWLRLDPTPLGESESDLLDRSGVLSKADELYSFVRLIWLDYVVNMNSQRQQETVFNPLVSGTRSAEERLLGGDTNRWARKKLKSVADSSSFWWYVGAVLAAGALGWLILRYLKLRRGAPRDKRSKHQHRPAPYVPFYDRLVKLLLRHGLARAPAQTQREFAGLVGGQLSESGLILDSAQVRESALVPRRVVEAYYRVRFGGLQLDAGELSEIDQSLDRLEAALAQGRSRPSHPRSNPPASPKPTSLPPTTPPRGTPPA